MKLIAGIENERRPALLKNITFVSKTVKKNKP